MKLTTKNDTSPDEEVLFTSLRASNWEEFHGQTKVKTALKIALTAAQSRKETVEHILLYGPPGLGKTTLAYLVARDMNTNIRTTSGPALEKTGDVAAILTNLGEGDILFIDEIHRLSPTIEEILYPAMEDFVLDLVIGKGPSARTVRIDVPKFTLIGATTRIGLLSSPLRDRFGIINRLNFYTPQELTVIIIKASKRLGIGLDTPTASHIAARARGTPRIALKLLKRVRDVAHVKGLTTISTFILKEAFDLLDVDSLGLDEIDRRLLLSIIEKHEGGPVGVETIAATLSEDSQTVEEVVEPYLLQIGFLKRTSRGRVVTRRAFAHLGKKIPPHLLQGELF